MYNRYIPQPDGSYRKNRIPENIPQIPTIPSPQKPPSPPCPPCQTPIPPVQPHKDLPCKHHEAGDFLRRLLPKDIDTGDLLIILLLLLMAGDNKEDSNTALLTLALYFFL